MYKKYTLMHNDDAVAPMFGLTRCFKYNGSDTLIYIRELTRKSTIHPDELEQDKEVFSRVAEQFESLVDYVISDQTE